MMTKMTSLCSHTQGSKRHLVRHGFSVYSPVRSRCHSLGLVLDSLAGCIGGSHWLSEEDSADPAAET